MLAPKIYSVQNPLRNVEGEIRKPRIDLNTEVYSNQWRIQNNDEGNELSKKRSFTIKTLLSRSILISFIFIATKEKY